MKFNKNNQKYVKFFIASTLFFLWATIQGIIQGQPTIHEFIELPPARIIVGAHTHIGVLGWVSLTLMGIIYLIIPKLTNKNLSWPQLVNKVFWLMAIGASIMAGSMILTGIKGGTAYQNGIRGEEIEILTKTYTPFIALGGLFSFLSSLLFSLQILHTIFKKK